MTAPTHETPTVELADDRAAAAAPPQEKQAMRINVPINLANLKNLTPEQRELCIWFHQYALDNNLSWKDAEGALGYDNTTVFKVLKGYYAGNWDGVCKAIRRFRQRVEQPLTLQKHEFVQTAAARLIFRALSYALRNNKMLCIIGESGQGKSVAAQAWRRVPTNNHGKTVMVIAPAYGGTKALLRDIATAVGVNSTYNIAEMHAAILRAFNKDRILVVDEAHRLLPNDRAVNPVNLEILRDIHDRTGCAVALIATDRFDNSLKKGAYMFEQVLGRSRTVRLARTISPIDITLLVQQYISRPTAELQAAGKRIAELPGRLRILAEVLKVAQDVAISRKQTCAPDHFFAAIKLIEEVQGEPLLPKS